MPKPSPTKNLVRPSAKDILLSGRGNRFRNFIGNRRFQKLVDMFIHEYFECDSRNQRSYIIENVVDIALKSGYRFLSQDEGGIFAPMPSRIVRKKVNAIIVKLVLS